MSDFSVVITLTKKGLANTDHVINAVFRYIQRLKEVGPQEWVFEETKKVGSIAFDYAEKEDPMDYAVKLVKKMHYLETADDMEHIIRSSFVADVYKPEKLTEIADVLSNPSNCLVILSSKTFEQDSLPIYEKWYKFNYGSEKFNE